MADAVLHTITKCVADFVVLVMATANYDLFLTLRSQLWLVLA